MTLTPIASDRGATVLDAAILLHVLSGQRFAFVEGEADAKRHDGNERGLESNNQFQRRMERRSRLGISELVAMPGST